MWKSGLILLLTWVASVSVAEVPKGIEFRADYYQRDLSQNTLIGRGNAWVRSEGREIFAGEIEIDFTKEVGAARGKVHAIDDKISIWADSAHFKLKSPESTFENGTVLLQQIVLAGRTIRRLDVDEFEIEEGAYSNCNTTLIDSPTIASCPLDWKISGRRFHLTVEGYAHFYDVLLQSRNVPLLYAPYLVVPVKTIRQSGILMPSLTSSATLGAGFTLPVYWAMSEWQDLLFTPTRYSVGGLHLATTYRYAYSEGKLGSLSFFLTNRRFGPASDPGPDDTSRLRTLGMFGEGAISAHNIFRFENSRAHSRQMVSLVSNPYYTFDYGADVGERAKLGNLRSQITYTRPSDQWLVTAQAQYLQSLVISKDTGVDKGGVAQLPVLTASRTTDSLWGRLFSYELDTQFTNFMRPQGGIDHVPAAPTDTGINTDNDPAFDANDYVRTGQRLQLEPRLIANLPMPLGFQFQPLLRTGSLLYHFPEPSSRAVHREYADIEVPIAMQLSRTFDTPFSGFQKINHVIQPRFIYSQSLLQTGGNDHPFFREDLTNPGLSNPRFDTVDRITPFQYMRFELINRFQRRKDDSSTERFFWFQVSQQINLKTSLTDPRYKTRLGPIEVFSALQLGQFSMQLQANYPLEVTVQPGLPAVKESTLSVGASLRGKDKNVVSMNGLFRDSLTTRQQAANLYFYQALASFFDLEGFVEYNLVQKEIYAWRVGLHFRSKPRSCWSLSLTTGQNEYKNPFTLFSFNLNPGGTGG